MEFIIKNCFYISSIKDNCYFLEISCANSLETVNSQISGRKYIFNDGWKPIFIFTGIKEFLLLELEHDQGDRSTWILDKNLRFLANELTKLTETQSRGLFYAGKPLLSVDQNSNLWRDFSELNDSIQHDIMNLLLNTDTFAQSKISVERRPVAICFSGHSRAFLHYSDHWRNFIEIIREKF